MAFTKLIKVGAIAAAVMGAGAVNAQEFITIGTGSVRVFTTQLVVLFVS